MILPPANHVVEAGDFRIELGDVVTIGEEPRNGIHRVGVPHSAKRDGRRHAVAVCANHVGRRRREMYKRLAEWIGKQVNRGAELVADDVRGPAQFVCCFKRGQARQVWMAVGVRSDVHPAGVELAYLLPVERDDVVGPAPPEPLESPEDCGIPVDQSGSDEERRWNTVLRQYRQRVRVIVLVSVVEGDRDERRAAGAGVAVRYDVGQRGHAAMRLQPLHMTLEDLRSRGGIRAVRVDGVIAEDDPSSGRVGSGCHSRCGERRVFNYALPSHCSYDRESRNHSLARRVGSDPSGPSVLSHHTGTP